MAQWEIRNKPGAAVAQTIEAEELVFDANHSMVKFAISNKVAALVVLTPGMTITKGK